MSAHTWDTHTHRQSDRDSVSEGVMVFLWVFPYTLKCKVDFHFPSALRPDQNTQCMRGERCPAPTSIHHRRQIPLTHILFLHWGNKKKKGGTNISVEAGILDMHMMPYSNPLRWALWAEGVMWCGLCAYVRHDLIDIYNTRPVMILCTWWKEMNKHRGVGAHKQTKSFTERLMIKMLRVKITKRKWGEIYLYVIFPLKERILYDVHYTK